MPARANNSNGRKGFEKRIRAVISMVQPILINRAYALRFVLPGISPGVFKTAPITTAGAYLK